MLVLSRKIGETLIIDGNVRVTVVRVSGNRVALGVEAPDDVRVLRGELRPFDDEDVDAPAAPEPQAKRTSQPTVRNEFPTSTAPGEPTRLKSARRHYQLRVGLPATTPADSDRLSPRASFTTRSAK